MGPTHLSVSLIFHTPLRTYLSQWNTYRSKFEKLTTHPKGNSTQTVCWTPSTDIALRHSTQQRYRGGFRAVSSLLLFCAMVTYRLSAHFGTWAKQESCRMNVRPKIVPALSGESERHPVIKDGETQGTNTMPSSRSGPAAWQLWSFLHTLLRRRVWRKDVKENDDIDGSADV